MNIQKEREEFESVFKVPAHWIYFDGLKCKYICKYNLTDDATIKYQARWESWLAAKSKAVPEGFVLVPNEKIASLVDELHVAFKSNLHLTTGELLPLQQDFQLMIEAQEQSHECD